MPDERWEIVVAAGVFGLTVLLVFAPWLFYGKAFYWGDIGLYFLPLNHFLKQNIESGSIPLWNPYLYCGAPFVGNPQVSVIYPSTLLLPFFPAVTAIMIAEVAHIFAAGMFFWLFARRGSFKLAYIPSLFAGSVYMLCGYFVAKAQFPNMLAALTFVPLLLYQTELLVQNPSVRRVSIFGAVLGTQLLAAHAQIVVFSLYLLVPYALVYYCASPKRHKFAHVLTAGIAGGIFAAGLACAYWLPVSELIHSSARQELTLTIANRFFLPTYELGNFIFPHLFGSPMSGNWHAHGNYWETDNYVGIMPFCLAVFYVVVACLRPKSVSAGKLQRTFWGVVFLTSVCLSLGVDGQLYRLAFYVLPALKAFHDPARLMLGANITVALFAGAGLEYLMTLKSFPKAAALLLIVASVIDLGWHDRGIYPLKPVAQIEKMANSPTAVLVNSAQAHLGAGRILMPDSRRSWQSFTTYKKFESNDPTFMSEWPDTLSPCLGMTYSIRDVGGYDPEYRKDSQELVDLAQQPLVAVKKHGGPPVLIPANLANYLAVLGVRYLVTYRIDPVTAPGLNSVYKSPWNRQERKVIVYANNDYRGRASVSERWSNVSSQNEAYMALSRGLQPGASFADFSEPILESPLRCPPSLTSSGNSSGVPATFVKDRPDDVELVTPPMSKASIMVLADTDHPGWSVRLDNKPSKILRANVDQRCVYFPPSSSPRQHIVIFKYRPADFYVGLYVTLLTISLFLTIFIGLKDKESYRG